MDEPVWHTLVQRRCTGVWGWSGCTCWAPWPQAEAWSPWATPVPSSSLCTHPRTVWQCPPLAGGWGRNKAPPWSTWPTKPNHSCQSACVFKLWGLQHCRAPILLSPSHVMSHSAAQHCIFQRCHMSSHKQFTTSDLVQVKDEGRWGWP